MTPVYSHRKTKRLGAAAGEQTASPGLPVNGQTPGIEVLEKSGIAAEQWNSAYQELFDRN